LNPRAAQLYWCWREHCSHFDLRAGPAAFWAGFSCGLATETRPPRVALDLARQSLDESAISDAKLIAIYLPMHTATRLAARLIPLLREKNPGAHLCCYGLYAPMNVDYLRRSAVCTILGGELKRGWFNLPSASPQM